MLCSAWANSRKELLGRRGVDVELHPDLLLIVKSIYVSKQELKGLLDVNAATL